MKKILDLSWRTALGNLLPSAHGHQGGSRKAIGFMLIVAFAVVGCDDSSSASAGQNDEPAVESSSSSVSLQSSSSVRSSSSAEPALSSAEGVEDLSSSSEKAKSSSSSVPSSSSVKSSSSVTPQSSSSSISVSSSSSVEESSSSIVTPQSSSSSTSVSSSSEVNCSALLEGEAGWSWDVPKECRFNPDIDYGTMTDERDGKTYKTVKIGVQTWMAENLNFDPGQGGSGEDKYDWSWCYNDDPKNCEVAGRLYTWAAAIDSVKLANDADNPQDCGYGKSCTLPDKVQGICPEGWHLPNNAEWNSLFTAVGGKSVAGKNLRSTSSWNSSGNGADAFSFSALPAGHMYDNGTYSGEGNYAYFWSSTEVNSDVAYYMFLYYDYDDAYLSRKNKGYGYSVRCVKD